MKKTENTRDDEHMISSWGGCDGVLTCSLTASFRALFPSFVSLLTYLNASECRASRSSEVIW